MRTQSVTASSRWDLLTIVLAGVIVQYVWRVQEVFRLLAVIQFTALVSVGAVLLFVSDRSPNRRVRNLRHRLFRIVLVIFVLAGLSVATSLHKRVSFDFVTGNFLKTVILTGIIAAGIRDRADVERLLRVLVFGGVGYIAAELIRGSTGYRLGGGVGTYDPNDLGLFAVATLPLCVYLMRREAQWAVRVAGGVAAVILLMGAVRSGSRGGFLALVAVAIYGLWLVDAVRSSKRIVVTVLAGAVLVGVAGASYWERMSTILNPKADYNWSGQSQAGRMEVWKRGLGYMMRRPVLGVGVNAFSVAEGNSPQASDRRAFGMGFKWSTAHSSFVQIGAELGVFGLALYIALLALAFREARRIGRRAVSRSDRLLGQAMAGLIVAYAVGGAFLSQAFGVYLYFSIGILIGMSRVVGQRGSMAAPQSLEGGLPASRVARDRHLAVTGRLGTR